MSTRAARGLELLIRPERAEALLWVRLTCDRAQRAREALFNRYAPLARSLARRYALRGRDASFMRDSEHWAYEGLLQAIDSFDPLRGAPFEAFARHRIIGAVRDGFARASEIDAQHSYRRRLERERLKSVKDRSGGNKEPDAIEALAEIAVGLAVGLMLEGTGLIADEQETDPRPMPYESVAWTQTRAKLAREVEKLSPAEATVIRQHYEHGLLFSQVAQLLGVTKGRVSQLHKSALLKLRKRVSKEE